MKLLLACTSGGHFSTMYRLKRFWLKHERVWVSDFKSDTEQLNRDRERVYWLPYQAPRDWIALIKNLPQVFKIVWQERPDMVVSTGASLAIGFAFMAKLIGAKFIYVESISRSKDISLSGKVVYYLADEFYVQNPGLCKKYSRVRFEGYVI